MLLHAYGLIDGRNAQMKDECSEWLKKERGIDKYAVENARATQVTAKVNRVVPQGDPASPVLFNIYIDTPAARICQVLVSLHRLPVRLYADDVIVLTESLWELLVALRICSKGVMEYKMQWSMDAAKSHVLLNKTRSENFKSLPFADGEVQSITQTKYLGINLTAQGIIPGLQNKKYHPAHQT